MSDPSDDRIRFQVELEFVQCLGNPNYLNFLAQRGYFKDPAFINYLKYLLYWKEPQYAHFLKYPMCLYFLDQLQYEHFRRELANAQCTKFIDDQQVLLWQHYTKKRTRLLTEHPDAPNNAANSGGNGSSSSSTGTSTSSSSSSSNGNGSNGLHGDANSCGSANGNNGNGNGDGIVSTNDNESATSNAGANGMEIDLIQQTNGEPIPSTS